MIRKRYFGDRLDELPLILAGPILRQVDQSSISVWLALKHPAQLKLKIFSTTQGRGGSLDHQTIEVAGDTIQIGMSLHLALLSAVGEFLPSKIYAYDVEIKTEKEQILSLTQLPIKQYGNEGLSYFEHGLPTFATPPTQIENLRLMHGSCRKPHGKGDDLLLVLDQLLSAHAGDPAERVQQLYLTGDQIYGDDAADPLLWVATDVGDMLLGWTEKLPISADTTATSFELIPGMRSQYAKEKAGLTSTIGKSDDVASSHFFSFGEYLAAYLLVWSPYLWPQIFPKGKEVQNKIYSARQWDNDVQKLRKFSSSLTYIRRSLANVATYMICDDHEVSDDWYLNRNWCERVLGTSLGYRIVFNALLAYAFFQAWGNHPAQFEPRISGETLKQAVTRWSQSSGTDIDSIQTIAALLGLPPQSDLFRNDGKVIILNHDVQALEWHYQVQGACHQVIVTDTRTWRGYQTDNAIAPPMLLSPTAFEQQLEKPLAADTKTRLTFVLLTTNLVCHPLIDYVQQQDLNRADVFPNDVGDAWNFNAIAYTQLLDTFRKSRRNIVILTGDIHYSCAIKMQLDTLPPNANDPTVIVQLTCSAIKNAEAKCQLAHTRLKSLVPEKKEDWLGWQNAPLIESQICTEGQVYRQRQRTNTSIPAWYPTQNFIASGGNIYLNWTSQPTLYHHPPNYRLQWSWATREPIQYTSFSVNPGKKNRIFRWFSGLWRNRWLQEGSTIVGQNNVGVISVKSEKSSVQIIQNCYWAAPWTSGNIVTSQYKVSLTPPPINN